MRKEQLPLTETNKWDDIENDFPYKDILYLEHPTSKKHPRMSNVARAGQFSPFAALTGYEDQVKETTRYTSNKIELEEAEKEKLDEILQQILKANQKQIKVRYFVKDKTKKGGSYQEKSGEFKKADMYHKNIIFSDKTKIPIQDIVKIEIINTQE